MRRVVRRGVHCGELDAAPSKPWTQAQLAHVGTGYCHPCTRCGIRTTMFSVICMIKRDLEMPR
ncbi:hypothetical protein TNCV_2361511 [Trichonephila clavipes]|nr:hypothetical protein TNCV_2361511 [Trichonephila clavipes]